MKNLTYSVLIVLIAFVAAGCDNTTAPEDAFVQIRAAHFSPDAPAVDVLVDGNVVLTNVPFRAISDYLLVDGESVRLQVRVAGDPSAVVVDTTVSNLPDGTRYTAAVTGLVSDLEPVLLEDDRSTNAAAARLRFAHFSPDAPAVDIALTGGDVLFANASFREVADYIDVPGGTYDLEVRLAGTDTVVLPLAGITVANGINYTAYAIGLAGDGSLTATVAIDS